MNPPVETFHKRTQTDPWKPPEPERKGVRTTLLPV